MPPKGYRTDGLTRGWTEQQLAYMRWICWPLSEKDERYQTKESIAALLEVEQDTLRNWENLAGFKQALGAMMYQVMLELRPLFHRNIAEEMLKPNPNDKIVQTYHRWILPSIERSMPAWSKLIQPKEERDRAKDNQREELTREIMELPAEQRDTLLSLWRRLLAEPEAGEAQVVAPAKNYDFTRKDIDREKPVKLKVKPSERPPAKMMLPLAFNRLEQRPQKIDTTEQDTEEENEKT